MSRIWSMAELAHAVGTSRQTMWSRHRLGLLPEPAYETVEGVPYWSDEQASDIIDAWIDDLRGSPRR